MEEAPRLGHELLVLARQHPRGTWATEARLGDLGRFWLERHAMFRRLEETMRNGAAAGLERRVDPAELRPWLARLLRFSLDQLEEHHLVEDRHYFPAFRRAEPRLLAGFELLERDHETIHAAIEALVGQANVLLAGLEPEPAAYRAGLARFHAAHAEHGRLLLRHLDDEEDLVIPLLISRGEDSLAGG